MSVISIIMAVGALQGGLLSAILFRKKGRKTADLLLGAWLALFVVELFLNILIEEDVYRFIPHILNLTMPFTFTYGPFFYLYTVFFTGRKRKWRGRDLLHLLPFLFMYAALISYFILPGSEKITAFETPRAVPAGILPISFTLFRILHGLAYIACGIISIGNFGNSFRENFSNRDKLKLEWLRNLAFLQAGIWITALIAFLLLFVNLKTGRTVESFIWPAAAVSVQVMGYLALRKPVLDPDLYAAASSGETGGRARYRKTPLPGNLRGHYLAKLERTMEREKPFLDPDLGLRKLAESCGVPVHYLSQIINTEFGLNFFNYINGYRIGTAKELLSSGDNGLSILDIAFRSGFSSKTSFNTLFKQATQKTPSAFRLETGSTLQV